MDFYSLVGLELDIGVENKDKENDETERLICHNYQDARAEKGTRCPQQS